MLDSHKRLLMIFFGVGLIVAFIFYYDITDIFEIEIFEIFILAVLVFFTIMNVVRFVIANRVEYYEKYGDTDEGR